MSGGNPAAGANDARPSAGPSSENPPAGGKAVSAGQAVARQRRWPGRLARAVTGVGVLVLAGAVVVGGQRVGAAASLPAAAGTAVQVPPAATSLVCPAGLELPLDAGTGDGQFDPVPVAPETSVSAVTVDSSAGALTATGLGTGAQLGGVAAGGGALSLKDPGTDVLLHAEPGSSAATWVSGSTVTRVGDGDLRGLAGASCAAGSADTWLVGGSTRLGATARLVVVNPSATAAQVTMAAWGAAGPLDLAADQLLVAPGARQVVVLGGEAAEQDSVVLRVRSAGAQVVAWVQDDLLDGFTPAGADLVVGGQAPATRQSVPGLLVDGESDAPVLRLLAPDEVGTASLTLLGGDGPVEVPGTQEVALPAGEVVDVSLDGLPAGRYTVVVDADVPVVAAAQLFRTGQPGELDDESRVDRAWLAATPGGSGVVAVPAKAESTIVVGAVGQEAQDDGSARATVRLIGGDGSVLAEHALSVDVGTTGAWELSDLPGGADAAAVQLVPEGDGPSLSWALVAQHEQADGVLVTALDPVPPPEAPSTLTARADPRLGLG